jgi:hypothetical protein
MGVRRGKCIDPDEIGEKMSSGSEHGSSQLRLEPMKKPQVDDLDNMEDLVTQHRLGFIVPVSQNALLISEIQRCGGTLLSQLLDGHPNLHVHPQELQIGRPTKYHWPSLDLQATSESWFEALQETPTLLHASEGYFKIAYSRKGVPEFRNDVLPFAFSPKLQYQIFINCLQRMTVVSQRDILDCYFTSYFNAWIDYQGLYRDPAEVSSWVGFVPRLYMQEDSVHRFFADYPQGRMVLLSRRPDSWFASARGHMPKEYADIEHSIALWIEGVERAIALAEQSPGNVMLITFEDLVKHTIETKTAILRFAGIDQPDTKVMPTFNQLPIKADSSFSSNQYGILKETLDRSQYLNKEERRYIAKTTNGKYEEFVRIASARRQQKKKSIFSVRRLFDPS